MKKSAIIVTVVLLVTVLTVLVSAAGRTRKLDTDYELNFEGNIAICTAIVTGETKSDFIQVTMRLKRENTVLRTWYREGYFQVAAEETCGSLTGGEVYTLEIIAKINGEIQPAMSTSRACPGGTTPTTRPTVPPTTHPTIPPTIHPTIPPTQPTVPTTQPTVPPTPAEEGSAIIFRGPPFTVGYPEWYPREGEIGHLYWAVKSTGESILVCDEPVSDVTQNDTHIYFVKKSEPTKVYVTAIGDFENHQVYYESSYGSVSDFRIFISDNFLHFVADGKKLVAQNIATGESQVLMEQYHINFAQMYINDDGTWGEIIEFEGQHAEDDWDCTLYLYNWKTGELWEDTTL